MRRMREPVGPPEPSAATGAATRATVVSSAVLVVAALYAARDILVPFALAALLTFLLSPLTTRIQRWGLPRVAAVLLVVAVGLSAFLAVGSLVATQAGGLAAELPRYRQNIVERIRDVRVSWSGSLGKAREAIQEIRDEIAIPPASSQAADLVAAKTQPVTPRGADAEPVSLLRRFATWPWSETPSLASRSAAADPEAVPVRIESGDGGIIRVLEALLVSAMGPLTTMGVATLFLVFMLIQREELRDRLICVLGRGHVNLTTEALDDAAGRVSRYLVAQVVTNALYGAVVGIGLLLIGVPRAALWGLLAALLRFIPYVGAVVAAALPLLLSLAVFDNWVRPLLVLSLFVGLDLVVVNILESWLYGARTGVTPIAIVASAVFWTWLWGGVGLFLATPLAACLVVVGRYVPQWRFLAVLLGDQPALPVHMRFYRRLLSLDELGAGDTLRQAQKRMSPNEILDAVILPALWEAEQDRRRGALQGRSEAFIRETVTEFATALHAPQDDATSASHPDTPLPDETSAGSASPDILCVPARGRLDEVTAHILADALTRDGHHARGNSSRTLAGELIETVCTETIPLVCICGLYPSSFRHIRYLCKRLRQGAPDARVVAALWTGPALDDAVAARIGADLDVESFTHLAEARRKIAALAQRPRPGRKTEGPARVRSPSPT